MYRWDWLILFATLTSSIKTADGVSRPEIKITPTPDLFPHWQTTFTLHCQVTDWPGSPVFFWKRDHATLYPNADSKIVFRFGNFLLFTAAFNSTMIIED